ncbi:HtaA domain-containing protein [Microbacterium sp. RD1]|uniref:HtaA domain-containing protein n=1 Tax=Microbacterium sp. RD1 TaxID=3457313 RepID=UPI003FA58FB2
MEFALEWAVKASLVSYVQSRPDGIVETFDGAVQLPAGSFAFPFDRLVDGEPRYRGGVRLRAHGGLLDVALTAPQIAPTPRGGISAVVSWAGDSAERLLLAHMDVARSGSHCWSGTAVRLTDDGAFTLGALQYYEGQPVDDVFFCAPERLSTSDE